MASQAAPMWQALPDGIFKRQLLGELAALIHLSADELQTLWGGGAPAPLHSAPPPPAGAYPTRSSQPPVAEHGALHDIPAPYAATRSRRQQPAAGGRRPRSSRIALHTHADHVLRYLLSHIQAWDLLSPAAHEVLLHQAAPHGAFFAWLESQYLHYGAQPWSALRMALQDPQHAELLELAERLMQSDHRLVEADHSEFLQNVHALQVQQLKQQQAMAYAQHDLALATRLGQQLAQLQQQAASA